jgi:hypothetical protein
MNGALTRVRLVQGAGRRDAITARRVSQPHGERSGEDRTEEDQ